MTIRARLLCHAEPIQPSETPPVRSGHVEGTSDTALRTVAVLRVSLLGRDAIRMGVGALSRCRLTSRCSRRTAGGN